MRIIRTGPIAYLGIIYRGAVVAPLDPAATTQTLAAFLKNSEAKLAFVSPASLDKFRSACELSGINIPVVLLRFIAHTNGFGDFADWAQTSVPKPGFFGCTYSPRLPSDIRIFAQMSA